MKFNIFQCFNNIPRKKIKLIAICSAVYCITAIIATGIFIHNNSLTSQASCDEEATRVTNLIPLVNNDEKYSCKPMATSDFVQPWLFNDYSSKDIYNYVKMLKDAGYENIILQNIATISGGTKNDAHFTAMWYNTSILKDTSTLDIYKPNVLTSLFNAAKKYDMGIFVGLGISNDWYNNAFTNSAWRYSNTILTNKLIKDIYSQYGKDKCFKGLYWSFELFPNNEDFEDNWSEMINYTTTYINKIENSDANIQSRPIIISAFFNDEYTISNKNMYDFFCNFIDATNFRTNDILCIQDCLTTTKVSSKDIKSYINNTKNAITDTNNSINFWISVENYRDITTTPKPADLVRYKLQLEICSKYAENLASFSYSHYYNPVIVDKKYDMEYRQYINNYAINCKTSNHKNTANKQKSTNTDNDNQSIVTSNNTINNVKNNNKSSYSIANSNEIYNDNDIQIPTGGFIFKDKNGCKAPIPAGFKVDVNSNVISSGLVIKDAYNNKYVWVPIYANPNQEINNTDHEQFEKYHGFYIGQYESSFNYNKGQPTVQIKNNASNKINKNFNWIYTNSSTYTGCLWNNISYNDAKIISENMCKKYNYNASIKTSLINETMWDIAIKWCKNSNSTNTSIQNNIHNLNDNLYEWTDKKNFESIPLENVGFRVVLLFQN